MPQTVTAIYIELCLGIASGNGLGRRESAWFSETGWEMSIDQWHDGGRRSLGMYVSDVNEAFYIFVHGGYEPLAVTLPGEPWASGYVLAAHTGEPEEFPTAAMAPGTQILIPARTILVLQATVATRRLGLASTAVPTGVPTPATVDVQTAAPATVPPIPAASV